jgi:quercetin dioxygenase-like cupin family protein
MEVLMRYLKISGLLAAGLLTLGAAFSQQTPPTENKGVSAKSVGAMDLGGEIEGLSGRQLRMRYITMEPGGHFAVHNHKDRPTLEYILAGTVIEYRDGVAKEHKAGDVVLADKNTTHWWQNKGTEQVVFLPVDIFKP